MDSTSSTRTPGASETPWRRASRCASSGCVEVAFLDGQVAVRDSKRPQTQVLWYDHDEWRVFVDGVKAGEFDLEAVSSR